MEVLSFIRTDKDEVSDFLILTGILALLFSFLFSRFQPFYPGSFLSVFLSFFLFLILLLGVRLVVMKCISYLVGYKLFMRLTEFDPYWLHSYDRVSYVKFKGKRYLYEIPGNFLKNITGSSKERKETKLSSTFQGVPTFVISILIFIVTLGFVVFPSMWRYRFDDIPHMITGTATSYETELDYLGFRSITGHRFVKIIFGGFAYYFIAALILKLLVDLTTPLGVWMFGILFYIGLFTLIPIPGTEGFDLWHSSRLAWVSSITILTLGTLAVLTFNDPFYVLFSTIIIFIIIIMVYFWRVLM